MLLCRFAVFLRGDVRFHSFDGNGQIDQSHRVITSIRDQIAVRRG